MENLRSAVLNFSLNVLSEPRWTVQIIYCATYCGTFSRGKMILIEVERINFVKILFRKFRDQFKFMPIQCLIKQNVIVDYVYFTELSSLIIEKTEQRIYNWWIINLFATRLCPVICYNFHFAW